TFKHYECHVGHVSEKQVEKENDRQYHGIALAELIDYIQELRQRENVAPVFKLSDLSKLYQNRLAQYGVKLMDQRVHTTRLKKRILSLFEDMKAYNEGKEVYLAFNDDVSFALKKAGEVTDYDDEAMVLSMVLSRAAKIVRRNILTHQVEQFSGSFNVECQKISIPQTLKTLVDMILHGSNIKRRSTVELDIQPTLSISQLMLFNCKMRQRDGASKMYHTKEREPLLPIYIGLTLHAETIKKKLVDKCFELGLSISYRRVMEITTGVSNAVCQIYHDQGVVCPPSLVPATFTTAAVDNIDHNPSSVTAHGSLHGTAISLFQHCVTEPDRLENCPNLYNEPVDGTSLLPLPDSYAAVLPVPVLRTEPLMPPYTDHIADSTREEQQVFQTAVLDEKRWLNKVCTTLPMREEQIESIDAVAWASFHAEESEQSNTIDKTVMLPIFQEQAKSAAMICHAMKVVRSAVYHINPGQTPVLACDQPLFPWLNKFNGTGQRIMVKI
ncbi:hypothetical protein MAR_025780, partial [Mya arenaria]